MTAPDPVWAEGKDDVTRFRMFRLVSGANGKLYAEESPLVHESANEFPIADLNGETVLVRWGTDYYRAQLFADPDVKAPGRGFSYNVHVDENGVCTRQVKRPSPTVAEVEASPPPPAVRQAFGAKAVVPAPMAGATDDDRFRAMLRSMNGEDAMILMAFAKEEVMNQETHHNTLRLQKTIEAFNFAGEIQRKGVERVLEDSRRLDERKLALEMTHAEKSIELQTKKLELKAAREIEDSNAEQEDRIEDLETQLMALQRAPTPAAAATAASNLLPLLVQAAPVLLALPAVQNFLKGIHPQAGAIVEALAPAALSNLANGAGNATAVPPAS